MYSISTLGNVFVEVKAKNTGTWGHEPDLKAVHGHA